MLNQETLWGTHSWLATDESTDTRELRDSLDKLDSSWRDSEGARLYAIFDGFPTADQQKIEDAVTRAEGQAPDSNDWKAAVADWLMAINPPRTAQRQAAPATTYAEARLLTDLPNQAWHKFPGWWVRDDNGTKLFATSNQRGAEWVDYDTMRARFATPADQQGAQRQPAAPVVHAGAKLLTDLPNQAWHRFTGWWVRDDNGTKLFATSNAVDAQWVDYDTMRARFAEPELTAAPKQTAAPQALVESPAVPFTWEDFTKDYPEMARLADIVEELGLTAKDADSVTEDEQLAITAKFLGVPVEDLVSQLSSAEPLAEELMDLAEGIQRTLLKLRAEDPEAADLSSGELMALVREVIEESSAESTVAV